MKRIREAAEDAAAVSRLWTVVFVFLRCADPAPLRDVAAAKAAAGAATRIMVATAVVGKILVG